MSHSKMVINKIVIVVSMFISGCAFLPAPLAYLNNARTGYDVTQIVSNEPTLAAKILSEATDMDCNFFNALDGEDICTDRFKEWLSIEADIEDIWSD
jgi:uncharacterized membrane protein